MAPRRRVAAAQVMASPLIFQQAKALLFESGASRRLGELVKGLGSKRTLLVTDPGVRGAGLLEEGVESLLAAGVHATVFDKTEADPPDSLVLECTALARDEGVDSVIGFGGGSSMDIAKLVALLASPATTQPLDEMYGVGNARGERLPLVQVPTTAGTGSEVTPISILTTGAAEKKGVVSPRVESACGAPLPSAGLRPLLHTAVAAAAEARRRRAALWHRTQVSPLLLPDLAVLDGDLTLYLPPHVSAATGIDAMAHAIEAYTSRLRKNPLSDVFARVRPPPPPLNPESTQQQLRSPRSQPSPPPPRLHPHHHHHAFAAAAQESLRLLSANIRRVCEDDRPSAALRRARADMLLGSCYAGMAFANAPVAAVHALAYPLGSWLNENAVHPLGRPRPSAHLVPPRAQAGPTRPGAPPQPLGSAPRPQKRASGRPKVEGFRLTLRLGARFHVAHGLSNSLMLPHVMAFNAEDDEACGLYRELAPLMLPHIGQGFAAAGGGDSPAAVRFLVNSLATLPSVLGLPTTLREASPRARRLLRLHARPLKHPCARSLPAGGRGGRRHRGAHLGGDEADAAAAQQPQRGAGGRCPRPV